MWVTCEAESLGHATRAGVVSLGPHQKLTKGEGCSSWLPIPPRQQLRTGVAQEGRGRRENTFLPRSMSCGASPHPLCDRRPEAHSDRGVLQGSPGLSGGQTTKGSCLGSAAPPRPSLASLQSLRRAPAPGPVALSEQPAIRENREHPVPKHSRKTDTPWGSKAEGSQIISDLDCGGGGKHFFLLSCQGIQEETEEDGRPRAEEIRQHLPVPAFSSRSRLEVAWFRSLEPEAVAPESQALGWG